MAVAGAVTASCSRSPSPVGARDVPGRYEGVALGNRGTRPARLRLALSADHGFAGTLPGGAGGGTSRTGRWRLAAGDAECRRLELIAPGEAPVVACLSRTDDGAVCLRWNAAASGCALTKVAGG